MDKLINKETGLEYANTDPSLHFNRVEKVDDSWRNEYLKLLTDRDHEAAHELRSRNDPNYKQETEPAVTVVKSESPRLMSCTHAGITQTVAEEDEEAA